GIRERNVMEFRRVLFRSWQIVTDSHTLAFGQGRVVGDAVGGLLHLGQGVGVGHDLPGAAGAGAGPHRRDRSQAGTIVLVHFISLSQVGGCTEPARDRTPGGLLRFVLGVGAAGRGAGVAGALLVGVARLPAAGADHRDLIRGRGVAHRRLRSERSDIGGQFLGQAQVAVGLVVDADVLQVVAVELVLVPAVLSFAGDVRGPWWSPQAPPAGS